MKKKRFSTALGTMLSIAILAGIMVPSVNAADFVVFNPLGEIELLENQRLAERLGNLNGKKIALAFYAKAQNPHAVRAIGEMLWEEFDDVTAEMRNIGSSIGAKPLVNYETLASYDAVVLGVADCTLSAWWAAYHAKMIESLGTPVVVLTHGGFEKALAAGAVDNGFVGVRKAVIDPGLYSAGFNNLTATGNTNFLRQTAFVATTERVPVSVYNQAKSALTTALTEAEIDPPAITAQQLAGWSSGDPTDDTLTVSAVNEIRAAQEFDRIAMELGFGDGLPLIMPLSVLVEDMLAATTRDRSDVLGKVMPRGGIITVEKVAINSVMAGARPEYFPVIIAAMEAYASSWEDGNLLYHTLTSSENYTLMLLISGPIVEELGISGQWGFLGSGNEANNAIGRAVRLSIRNIGQNRTHETDGTSRVGRQNDHTLTVFGEQANILPAGWERHHEMMGFAKEESTITLHGFNAQRMYSASGGVNASFTPSSLISGIRTTAGTSNVSIATIPRNVADLVREAGTTSKTMLLANNQMGPNTAYRNLVWPVVVGDPESVRVYFGSSASGTAYYGTQAFQTRLISGATKTNTGRGPTTPGAPQNFKVTRNGDAATLTWNAPLADGGRAVIRYQVSYTDGSAAGAVNSDGIIPSVTTSVSNPAAATGTATAIPTAPVAFPANTRPVVPAWTDVPEGQMSFIFNGLIGDGYFFKVRAINDVRNAVQLTGAGANRILDDSVSGRGAWAAPTPDGAP